MRICTTRRWAILIAVALAPAIAAAQQAGSLVSPQVTPITVDPPRTFPAGAAFDARPLSPAVPPTARRAQPPVNVQVVSGQEPISNSKAKSPLRLSPRSEAGRPHSQKPAAP